MTYWRLASVLVMSLVPSVAFADNTPHTHDPCRVAFVHGNVALARSTTNSLVQLGARDRLYQLVSGWAVRSQGSGFTSYFLLERGLRVVARNDRDGADGTSESSSQVFKTSASVTIDRKSVVLHEDNLKSGVTIEIENKSRLDKALSIVLPQRSLICGEVFRIPEQIKVPHQNREQITVHPHSRIAIVLIPKTEPASLQTLDGNEIVIQVIEANETRETFRLPVRVAPGLKLRMARASSETTARTDGGKSEKGRTEALTDQSKPIPRSRSIVADSLGERLVEAAKGGDLSLVESLLREGADTSANDDDAMTPLTAAACTGHRRVVELFLERGVDVNTGDGVGRTALMWAAVSGHPKAANQLLDKGADVNAKTKDGWTALMCAAENGQSEILKTLLDKGANANAVAAGGWTALMSGAAKGNTEIIELLLTKGADVNAKSNRPFSYLQARSSWWVASGALEEFLKEEGESGWTALMSAAAEGHGDVVKVLLRKGADVNAKTRFDWTALNIARKMGHRKIEQLLKAGGAKE